MINMMEREIFVFVVAVACAFACTAALFPALIFAFARTVAPIFAAVLALTPTLTLATASIAAEDLPTPQSSQPSSPAKPSCSPSSRTFHFTFDADTGGQGDAQRVRSGKIPLKTCQRKRSGKRKQHTKVAA